MTRVFLNRSLASFVLLMNVYFIWVSIDIIKSEGGPMGIALIGLPIFLLINLFAIPAFLTIFSKFANRILLLVLNCVGTAFILFLISLSI